MDSAHTSCATSIRPIERSCSACTFDSFLKCVKDDSLNQFLIGPLEIQEIVY